MNAAEFARAMNAALMETGDPIAAGEARVEVVSDVDTGQGPGSVTLPVTGVAVVPDGEGFVVRINA